ncbi:MAG: diversity-generating retroelement protein Avd [Gammaproteobacteria bacterium]|nr:diversity-generating retroelement protein Avd [Gammaproteobacteria bacterium]
MTTKPKKSSVPKAVEDTRELLLWMIPQLDKLPRKRRFTLGEKLENRLLTILESLVTAAYTSDKRSYLTLANRDLEVCRHLWRLCHDFKAIPTNRYEQGGRLMFELGKQIGGWIKASR